MFQRSPLLVSSSGARRLISSAVRSTPASSPTSASFHRSFSSRCQLFSIPLSPSLIIPQPRFFSTSTPNKTVAPAMMCFQCEQTSEGTGCKVVGVCGKTPETAALQDLLLHVVKGISNWAVRLGSFPSSQLSEPQRLYLLQVERFVRDSLFSTMTNVNFDPARMETYIKQGASHLKTLKDFYLQACKTNSIQPSLPSPSSPAEFIPGETREEMEKQAKSVGVLQRREIYGEDVAGVIEMIIYGLKGMNAYADHAAALGITDSEVTRFVYETLDEITKSKEVLTLPKLLGLALEVGKVNLKVMEILEKAHVSTYGAPTPTKVRRTLVKGKSLLVSGHDMKDLEEILKRTEGKGINVYTHGEMLPAHGYPNLRKYKHLVGNFGGAWQLQRFEFSSFPGPILITSNCLVEPRKSYKGRIFTRNVVGWPGVTHLNSHEEFDQLVEAAQECEAVEEDEEEIYISVGFGKDAVMSYAPAIIDAIQKGNKKHFFYIGGCDGSEGERNYFKEIAFMAAKDPKNVIITSGCGKYRFIDDLSSGQDAEGLLQKGEIPRVLDMGQCNDAYGAIQVAVALVNAFKLPDINALPLSFAVSWFEQKAVAILLTLLHLGVKDIRLGPNLPAFVTPSVLKVLVDGFRIRPIDPLRITQEYTSMIHKNA